MIKIAYHPIYKYPLPADHRFPMKKYTLLPEQLLYEGSFTNEHFFPPDKIEDEFILLTHTKEYLHKLHTQTLNVKEVRAIGFPMSPLLVERSKHIAQGTVDCALHAFDGGVSLNIAGGTHHAYADRGEGFCLFNDIGIAANYLLHMKMVQKILIVDLDVHQGNGTAKIFENKSEVFTFSMHGEKNYPIRKEKSDLDIGLPDGTGDNVYLNTLNEILPMLIEKAKPDIIFYQSGVDVLATDKLGRLSLTQEGCKQRDEVVMNLANKRQIPLCVSMGGGYSPLMADVINAHANTYRVAKWIWG
jgi:acetoin utilization deacetylase AcuC-like enzyme